MSSLSSSLAKNSALQIGGKILGTFFGLVTFYFLIHFYGTEGYGYLTTALTFVSIFAIVVDFGLTLTTTQMISEKGSDEEKILGNLLTLRVLTALGFLALAPITALFIPRIEAVFILVAISAASSFFGSVAQTFIGVFQKRIALTIPVLAETANRAAALGIILYVGYTSTSLAGAAIAFLVGGVLQLAIMLWGTSTYVTLRPAFNLSIWSKIIGRSWPIGLSILFNLIYLKGDIFFMALFERSYEEIGQYGSAYKVVDVITMIPVTFMGLVLPLLTSAWTEKAHGRFEKHLQDAFDVFSLIAIPFAVGAIMLGVPLMTFVKPDLVLAGQVLAVLGPAAAIVFYNSLYGHTIVALNKQRVMTFSYLFVAIIAVLGYVLYVPRYGAWAAAWVTLLSEAIIAFLTFVVVTRATKIMPGLKMFSRAILASIIMGFAIYFTPVPHVLLEVLYGIVVYGVVVVLLGGPSPRTLIRLFAPEKPPVNI